MIHPDDDEGLIDLRGLRLTPRHGPHAISGVSSSVSGVAPTHYAQPYASPFQSEPPPAAFASDATGAEGGSPRKAIGVVAAILTFVVLGGIAGAVTFRGDLDFGTKPAPAAAAAPVAKPPAAIATAPSAAPPASASASAAAPATLPDDPASKVATAGKKGKKLKGRGGGKARQSKEPKEPKEPAPPAPPKATDPCNCKGDLQCNIKCAAGGK